jgi:putative flippase GtrA
LYIKAQAALVAGSIVDFTVIWFLVSLMGSWYVAGNAVGNVSGAIGQCAVKAMGI